MKEGSSSVCVMEYYSIVSIIYGGVEFDLREKKFIIWWEDGEWC